MRSQFKPVRVAYRGRTGPAWYVVHTRPRKEQQVAQAFAEQLQLEVYLPEVWKRRRDEIRASPFFPGYLFAKADLSITPVSSINTLPGIVRLVHFGDVPQHIPDTVVAELRRQVDQINECTGALDGSWEPGATVQVVSGPLRGLEGTFVGRSGPSLRVRVLIEFLGQLRDVELDTVALDPAGTAFESKQQRRTRGRGRRVTMR